MKGAQCRFVAVDVEAYGKNSVGHIYANFSFDKALKIGKMNVSRDRPLPGTEKLCRMR